MQSKLRASNPPLISDFLTPRSHIEFKPGLFVQCFITSKLAVVTAEPQKMNDLLNFLAVI